MASSLKSVNLSLNKDSRIFIGLQNLYSHFIWFTCLQVIARLRSDRTATGSGQHQVGKLFAMKF